MDSLSLNLCGHCGETLLPDEVASGQTQHEDCEKKNIPNCRNAVRCFLENMAVSPNVLYMGIDVRYLYGISNPGGNMKREIREKRNRKLSKVREYISALRNSNGGYLLVQIIGVSLEENYMGAFDEFADETLYKMIEDGTLFERVYKKGRLAEVENCHQFTDFISVFVTKGTFWSTSDFKTKISLDVGLLSPLPITMINYVTNKRKRKLSEVEPTFKFDGNFRDIERLQERRDIQLKSFKPDTLKCNWPQMTNPERARKVWDVYRLKEYISAFSKNTLGGSVILGIGEIDKEKSVRNKDTKYRTKGLEIQGLELEDEEAFARCLEDIAQDESLICTFEGEVANTHPVIKVQCTEVPGEYDSSKCRRRNAKCFIVEVVVYPVHGVVFYDKQGPVSCRIVKNWPERVDCKTWFKKIKLSSHAILRQDIV